MGSFSVFIMTLSHRTPGTCINICAWKLVTSKETDAKGGMISQKAGITGMQNFYGNVTVVRSHMKIKL